MCRSCGAASRGAASTAPGSCRPCTAAFLRLLPRDADAQETAGREVEIGDVRAGDLLCYGDHIAIATERGTIIHAYGQAGGVVETAHLDELRTRLRTVRRVFEAERS